MQRRPHPNPALAARGVTIAGPGASPASPAGPVTSRRSNRPPLLDELLDADTVNIGRSLIGAGPDVVNDAPAENADWFGLARIDPRELGREYFFNGLLATVGACDVAGAGLVSVGVGAPSGTDFGQVIAYGDRLGRGAAVVIGLDLPITVDSWSFAPFRWPGFESTAGRPALSFGVVPNYQAVYGVNNAANGPDARPGPIIIEFAAGNLQDASPQKMVLPRSLGAMGRRVTEGSALCIALVFRGGTINQGDTSDVRLLCMHVGLQLTLASTLSSSGGFKT